MLTTIELITRSPVEKLKKGLKDLKGFATPKGELHYQPTRHSIAPSD
jgi:hypothetical protein